MRALLEARGLRVQVGTVQVCERLCLRVDAGARWGILGRNGTGKTTLLHTLAGLRAPTAGTVLLDGMPLARLSRRAVARRVGVLFQDPGEPFPSSVLETALSGRHPYLGAWRWEGPEDLAAARGALRALGLAALERRALATLSGGERQRLALATLLVQDPALYLLDEPTNHLDLHHQLTALEQLHQRAGNAAATVMVLHDVNLASRYCDHLLLLFGVGETAVGPAAELLTAATLERLYQHPMLPLPGRRGVVWVPG